LSFTAGEGGLILCFQDILSAS